MIMQFLGADELDPRDRTEIAGLIKTAFKDKFAPIFSPVQEDEWIPLLESLLSYERGVYYKKDGRILGVGILMTAGASYMNLPRSLGKTLGLFRLMLLKLVFSSRIEDPEILHLEMLAVSPEARGMGIGTKILNTLPGIAGEEGRRRVSLEVVDTNPRARALYESLGYRCRKTRRTGFLTSMAGFRGYSLMELELEA